MRDTLIKGVSFSCLFGFKEHHHTTPPTPAWNLAYRYFHRFTEISIKPQLHFWKIAETVEIPTFPDLLRPPDLQTLPRPSETQRPRPDPDTPRQTTRQPETAKKTENRPIQRLFPLYQSNIPPAEKSPWKRLTEPQTACYALPEKKYENMKKVLDYDLWVCYTVLDSWDWQPQLPPHHPQRVSE